MKPLVAILLIALAGCASNSAEKPDVDSDTGEPAAGMPGTTWTLETIFVGDVAASTVGEPATLSLRSDGTFSGSTGCHAFDGTWSAQGELLVASGMAVDDRACDAELLDQDERVLSVIGGGFLASVEGQLLTLTDPGGVGLVYRAGP